MIFNPECLYNENYAMSVTLLRVAISFDNTVNLRSPELSNNQTCRFTSHDLDLNIRVISPGPF